MKQVSGGKPELQHDLWTIRSPPYFIRFNGLCPRSPSIPVPLMDKAPESVRRLPPSSQDEIAHAMLALAGDRPTFRHCRACPGNPSIFEKCLSKNDGCAGQARA
jgi:hypothetical protein